MNTTQQRRVDAPEQERVTQQPEAATGQEAAGGGKTKTVVIDGGLHARLKVRAAQEGRKLQDLVEAKLRELLIEEVTA